MPITFATMEDVPQLVELLGTLFEQEAEFEPDAARQTEGLRRILQAPETGTVLVARENGRVIGMVVLLFTVSTALGAPVAWLEDMVVLPAYRGRGWGSRLLTAAIEHARASGCRRLTLLTDASNRDAQRFYERAGFTQSSMIAMRCPLSPAED